jgi:predicted nucleic acid-binding protein
VDGYLLDTCTISAYWDAGHPFHSVAKSAVDSLPEGAPRYVSRITIAEIEFGVLLDQVVTGSISERAMAILERAQEYPIREITKHTAHEYAVLRKNIAATHLGSFVRSNRPRWIDLWVDRATQERLQIDENDVWLCAQAREVNLVVVTTDEKMVTRISTADSVMQFQLLRSS